MSNIWNSSLRRKTPMKRSGFKTKPRPKEAKPRSTLGPGKKTKQWSSDRRKLKEAFKAAGITTCEVKLPGCWGGDGLGFMHSRKRRNVVTESDRTEVCLGCNPCHDAWEALGEARMGELVREVIANRIRPVVLK